MLSLLIYAQIYIYNLCGYDGKRSFARTKAWPDRQYVIIEPLGRNSAAISIEGIPYGKYAVIIFQDLNGNKKLDKRFLGIPAEPVAFSNDFHPLLGPPKWKDCEFDYSDSTYTINISRLIRL